MPSGDPQADTRANKRDAQRIQILGELHGEVMVFQPMTIREISHGGVQVETSVPFQVDSLHELRLSLGDRSVVLKGRVAHCRISDVDQELVTYRSGFEFIEPSNYVSTAIDEFIDAIKSLRRPT